MDPFDEGEQTLIRPDFEPGEDLEGEEIDSREKLLFRESPNWKLRLTSGKKNNHLWSRKQKCPSEIQKGSKAKKSWKSLYDERMSSLRTEVLSSSYDHPEVTHPDLDFTLSPRNDMSRKALSASPTSPCLMGQQWERPQLSTG